MKKSYKKPLIKIKKINLNLFFVKRRSGLSEIDGSLLASLTCGGLVGAACPQ